MRARDVAIFLSGSFVVFVACASQAPSLTSNDAGTDAPTPAQLDAIAEATGFDSTPIAEGGAFDLGVADAFADPPATNGTRIKAKYHITASQDGAQRKEFAGWFDSERNEKCSPDLLSDGSTRCLPTAIVDAVTYGVYFSDPQCKKLIDHVPAANPCGDATKYIRVRKAETCGASWTIYAIDTQTIARPSIVYRKGETGTCAVELDPQIGFATTYVSAGEMLPAYFAPMTISRFVD